MRTEPVRRTSSATSPAALWRRPGHRGAGGRGLLALHRDARASFDGLTGDALPLVIISLACGSAVLVLLRRGAIRSARVLAVVAVVA